MTALSRSGSPIRVVEFVGMMGSGKTALTRLVEERLRRHDIHIYNFPAPDDWILRSREIPRLPEAPLARLAQAASGLALGLQALHLGWTVRPRSLRFIAEARRLTGWRMRTEYLKLLPRNHIAVQDEGAVHLIMPLVLSGWRYGFTQLDRLAKTLAADEHKLFVFLRVGPDAALQRLRQRSGLAPGESSNIWRYNAADPEQERQIMFEMETLFERIGQSIRAVASQRTLVVTNSSDPAPAADTISAFIRAHLP